MTTNALERLREKKRSGQPLTPLENVVWNALWTQDPDVFDAAAELEAKDEQIQRFLDWHLEQGRMITELRQQLADLKESEKE